MRVLIIEDEEIAADRLQRMLKQLDDSFDVEGITDSIESSVKWLETHDVPDLIFADIHLADGHSFEIFKKIKVTCPIIFTTAYDQYAIKAFKFNSIDYLLKPLKKAELEESIQKFKETNKNSPAPDYTKLLESLKEPSYQKRLVIRFGQTIKTVDISAVSYFYTEEKVSFVCTKEKNRWPVDQSLDELEGLLDPTKFFRINRQFIINIDAIESMHRYSKSRVKIVLNPKPSEDPIVSAEKSPVFKEWLLGKA